MEKKRDDIEKNRGRVWEGEGSGARSGFRSADDGKRFGEVRAALNVSFGLLAALRPPRGRVREGERARIEVPFGGRRMTGSACRSTFRYGAARDVSLEKKR